LDDESSWLESRRLIITQLKSMDDAIRTLTEKIERQSDVARERIVVVATDTQKDLADLRVRIAMLEVSAKIWGGVLGLVGGSLGTLILDVLLGKFGGK
jgi:hypothetical protein